MSGVTLTIGNKDFTGQLREGWEIGGRAMLGESDQGTIVVHDEAGAFNSSSLSPGEVGKTAVLRETTNNTVLARGRVVIFGTGRPYVAEGGTSPDRQVDWHVQIEDANRELKGIDIETAIRPQETDVARVRWVLSTYLSGSPRATTVIADTYVAAGNTVTLEPKTYRGTDPYSIIADCANEAGKQFFVTSDNELFYDLNTSTAYAAGLAISDRLSELTSGATAGAPLYAAIDITGNQGYQDGSAVIDGNTSGVSYAVFRGQGAHVAMYWPTPVRLTTTRMYQGDGINGGLVRAGWRLYGANLGNSPTSYANVITFGDLSIPPDPADWTELLNAESYASLDDSGDLTITNPGNYTHYMWMSTTYDGGGPLQTQWAIREIGYASTAVAIVPPIWDGDVPFELNGQQLDHGVRLWYGADQSVLVTDPDVLASHDYFIEQVFDDQATTSAGATRRANAVINQRKYGQRTYNVSVRLTPAQVGLVKYGQTIQIKARAVVDADDAYVTRRIGQLRWTHPGDDVFFAHMQLDVPTQFLPGGAGSGAGSTAQAAQKAQAIIATAIPFTTAGDMLYRASNGSNTRLAIGPSNTHLRSDGIKPVWSPETAALSNPMTTAGDIIVGGASGTPTRLAIGASNTILASDGVSPVWDVKPSGGTGLTDPMTTIGDIIIRNASNVTARLGIGASNTVLTSLGSGNEPVWQTPTGGGSGATYYSVRRTSSVTVTDGAAYYDIPGLSISNVGAGTYLVIFGVMSTPKSGSVRFQIADGSNTELWPTLGSGGVFPHPNLRGNTDGILEEFATGIIVLGSTSTVKLRGAAAAAISNWNMTDAHLTLIKIA